MPHFSMQPHQWKLYFMYGGVIRQPADSLWVSSGLCQAFCWHISEENWGHFREGSRARISKQVVATRSTSSPSILPGSSHNIAHYSLSTCTTTANLLVPVETLGAAATCAMHFSPFAAVALQGTGNARVTWLWSAVKCLALQKHYFQQCRPW